jgi:hypothetical protein
LSVNYLAHGISARRVIGRLDLVSDEGFNAFLARQLGIGEVERVSFVFRPRGSIHEL